MHADTKGPGKALPVRISIIIAAALASLAVSNAHAEAELPPVMPYEPVLRDGDPEAKCAAFASAWRETFGSEKPLQADWVDLEAAYPEADIYPFPPQRDRGDRYRGLYDKSFHLAIDFDGDGADEILHVEAYQIGWRYLGARLYLFETEADYSTAKTVFDREWPGQRFAVGRLMRKLDPAPKLLFEHPPASVIFVLALEGSIYTTAAPRRQQRGRSQRTSLVRLNGSEGPDEVCTVHLFPKRETLQAFIDTSPFFQSLKSIYGGSQGCSGTMGWTAPPADQHLFTLFHRPQAMSDRFGGTLDETEPGDAAREIRLLVWGLADPTSWSVYRRLKDSRAGFLRQLTNYYRRHFADSDSKAEALAARGYRFLVDRIVYARNPDGYRLTRVALDLGDPSEGRLRVGGSSAPETIARAAIDRWLQLNPETRPRPIFGEDRIWHDAILAALYTRQHSERLVMLWSELNAILAAQATRANLDARRVQIGSWRIRDLNSMLLAAQGDPGLTALILSFGADVDAPTNWFGKTPLMYAAQSDDLTAVRVLLDNGADPSAQTETSLPRCYKLARDARTPLMYAAENASPELISALLQAGADPAAADTQGNTAVWYLERNAQLSDGEKSRLRQHLIQAE